MCILCDEGALELLTRRIDELEPGELADAIRVAREAASAGVVDHSEAVLAGRAPAGVSVDLFTSVVVERALQADLLGPGEGWTWGSENPAADARLTDPRVQAFLASCAEVLDEYRLICDERRRVLQRFLEVRPGAVRFGWIGIDGELWFRHGEHAYTVLSREEALEVVIRAVRSRLYALEPATLLAYTALPEAAGLEMIEAAHQKAPETANELLAGLVDIAALAEDQIRAAGHGPFLQADPDTPVEELHFGEWVVIRTRAGKGF